MKLLKNISLLCTLGLVAAVAVFYSIFYPAHLHYFEQVQMFLFTKAYFFDVAPVPGGLVDYVGRFLTQFFGNTWVGSAVWALLFGGVFWLSAKNILGDKNDFRALFLLLPIRYLWIFACDENAMPGTWLALIVVLATAILTKKMLSKCEGRMYWTALTLAAIIAPVLYMIAGPLAVVYVVSIALFELMRGRLTAPIVLTLVAIATPIAMHPHFSIGMKNLLWGVHYFRFADIMPAHLWVAVALMIALEIVFAEKTPFFGKSSNFTRLPYALAAFVLVVLLVFLGVKKNYRPNTEAVMQYDEWGAKEQWNEILESSKKRMPIYPGSVANINLALIMTGQAGDHLFDYYQPGVHALLPYNKVNFPRPMSCSDIFFKVGWTNLSLRFAFEAKEALADHDKSARAYMRLAECHIVRRQYDLAKKYLHALENTLLYKDWAKDMIRLIDTPLAVAENQQYGQMQLAQVKDDYFFSADEMKAMLANYCATTAHNRVAIDYLLALCLIDKDLDLFEDVFKLSRFVNGGGRIPVLYQQALALQWTKKHDTLNGIPYQLDQMVVNDMDAFISSYETVSPQNMQKRFGKTFWYYYMFQETTNENKDSQEATS